MDQRTSNGKTPDRAGNAKPRGRRQNHAQRDALTRTDLRAIWRYFSSQSRLTDDLNERFLHALLLKGLPATQVPDVAPWARRRGVDYYIDKANADLRIHDADRLGELIEFEFDDLKAMKRDGYSVRHIAPFDADRGDVQEFWEDEERIADRERKQLSRKQRKESTMPKLTKRTTIIHKAIGTNWISVPALMKAVAPKMRNERNRMLVPTALRSAVKRGIDELVAHGIADTKIDLDERGRATQFTRRSHMTGQIFAHMSNSNVSKKTSGDVATQ